jgi:3-hydroxyacyl-CoA dehydrogenase/enoyl-CoA hydratase/3-hydroxybutyryl-CoA epimerase
MQERSSGLRHEIDPQGVLHVVFDRPGDKVNLLDGSLLRRLDGLVDEIRRDDRVRGIVFRSEKHGCFIAGMDVEEIASFTDAFKAAEGARFGQAVFQKIADLPLPTVAAIDGTCLGGGTELALACRHRLATDDRSVKIGLPEVRIGIIPGFGGSQRLPRLVGLLPALDLILTGRSLDGRAAARIGLVDKVVPSAYLLREAAAFLEDGAAGRTRRARPLWHVGVERLGPLRRLLLARARKRTEARVAPESYPAPFLALEAVEAAFALGLRQGLDLEARIVGDLVPTRTSKNLIWLFKSQNALKKEPGGFIAVPRKVRRAAVVGAGIMGGGIAQLIADRKIPVRMKDVRGEALLGALRTASNVWRERVDRGRMTPREMTQARRFLSTTLDDTGLSRVDIVVEAVVENLEVKQRALSAAEERIPDRAVFASNTSTLPISDIAAAARHPERVVGMHFFNPVHRMPLVEVIAGQRTSPEAVSTVHAFAIELGKIPVVVRDAPGFLVNRILMLYLSEAARLLGEGVPIESVDTAAVAFGMPTGPFALLDEIGLDTANHAAAVLEGAFGRRIGGTTPVLAGMVERGRLGRKSGRGFYRYRDGRRGAADPEPARLAGAASRKDLPPETLQERLILAMVNEAVICLEDGVVRDARDLDVAMVMGTGFPAFRGGLLRYADEIGVVVLEDRLSRLADAHGERFRPAGTLRDMVRADRRFHA